MRIDSNTSLKNNKHENSLTKTMKFFKLKVTSMTSHYLCIKTPDDIDEDDIRSNFRKFDGGIFSTDDIGDWEYSDTDEISEEDYENSDFSCNWEDRDQ